MFITLLMLTILSGVLAGYLAQDRKRSFWLGFVLGISFGPLGVAITCLIQHGKPKAIYRAPRRGRQW